MGAGGWGLEARVACPRLCVGMERGNCAVMRGSPEAVPLRANGTDACAARCLWRSKFREERRGLITQEQVDEPCGGNQERRRSQVKLAFAGHLPKCDEHE